MSKPHWLEIAEREIGTKEITGDQDNPRIVEYAQATSLKASDDETAWCSSFVNWCMMQAGIARTNSAAARSWSTWGRSLPGPVLGCVVVLSRPPNPAQGHVAFCVGTVGADRIALLGGNQGNSVSVATYPRSRVVAYRWPTTLVVPTDLCPPYSGQQTGEASTA